MLTISVLPALADNYIYLLTDGNRAAVVDPGVSDAVLDLLKLDNLKLSHILCTHYHDDHIGGVSQLKAETGAIVLAPNDSRIPLIDKNLQEGDRFSEAPFHFEVLSVPGHTSIHLAYYFPHEKWVFTGDALFGGGCGRLFEGSPEQMWTSLSKLMILPDETQIYCGHEYTVNNLKFAHAIEPTNLRVAERLTREEKMRTQDKPTIPSTIGLEKQTNPFLRVADPSFAKAIGMSDLTNVERFAEIRRKKDLF